ncbi:MAG: PIN domain-containing protein [Nitrospiraceae bacterium]|nr:MAG: PIN domain-containing protein [Nitrospiraceae bacterium]
MVSSQPGDFFKKHRKVYLDTSVFIYFVERHPHYYDLCDEIFRDIEEGRIEAATSTLTLIEILVQPYRLKKEELVLKFYSLFTTYPHLQWIQLTLGISDLAAKLRAEHNLKTPDAIQIASALSDGATGFVCNDKAFRRVKEIECLILGDWAQKN